MIYKEHYIELYINNQKAELESQKSLNLRFQNVLFNPEKISSTQAEYSFEFEIPSTPVNDKIFDYANNLSKVGKFRTRFNATVYADGQPIFNGSLTLNSFKDKKYNCNLVSVKVYSLEDIFGDSTMNELNNWKIVFNGVETINMINEEPNPEVVFPLVAYGAPQKSPKSTDEVGNEYTSKYDLDEYNRWYVESFEPSLKLVDTLKHLFAYKGYELGGDIVSDSYLNKIYISNNYADGQDPEYNVGNPRFGKVDLQATITTNGSGYGQELNFPYYSVHCVGQGPAGITSQTEYNFSAVNLYSVLGEGTVTVNNVPNYMYQPNEGIIVVPADGWYRISLYANSTINTTGNLAVGQWVADFIENEMEVERVNVPVGIKEITPIEIQLVRNYNDNIELIKGKHNRRYANGNPTVSAYTISGRLYNNIYDWDTCYPHEDLYASENPTEENGLVSKNRQSHMGGKRSDEKNTTNNTTNNSSGSSDTSDTSTSGNFSGRRGGTRGGTIDIHPERYWTPLTLGYMYENDNQIMAYDQAVTDTFICGLSSLSNGVSAYMKNGYSWSPITSQKNESFAAISGYDLYKREEGTGAIISESSDHNENNYYGAAVGSCTTTDKTMTGNIQCMVWLNKNDILQLYVVHRGYEDEVGNIVSYGSTTNVSLTIEAYSDRSQNDLITSSGNSVNTPVEFDDKLNLGHFLNKEKQMADWVQNVVDAFNLEVVQYGKTVELNTKKKFNRNLLAAVELDDRTNANQIESEKINYPRSMSVRYKIDTDEHGFYDSVPPDKINLPDWKDYGDSGYSVVELNDDLYAVNTSDKNTNFSYTWYDDFNWYPVDSAFTKTSSASTTLTIPVISKEEYMIDGYDYSESMKHDGYGLTQRFWFKPTKTQQYVWTRTYPAEQVNIFTPINAYSNLNLSYKNTENSLLNQYFNFIPYLASNYIILDVYLTPDEYNMIKNGALVHIDSDLYYPVEINGYDPTGYNKTELKLMKKL